MSKRNYSEVYGFLPKEIIDFIPRFYRYKLFINYLDRQPTNAGIFITNTVIETLGERFIWYMLNDIVNSYDENEEFTRDDIIADLKDLITSFSADSNVLEGYVATYLESLTDDSDSDSDVTMDDTVQPRKQKRDSKGRFMKSE